MTERDELREKIRQVAVEIIDAAHGFTCEFNIDAERHRQLYDFAEDRILALLPPQPRPEWREQYLMIGNLSVGYYHVAGNGWHAHVGSGRDGEYFGPIDAENAARAAVEQAVKEALGWPK